jgi:hypothetical protein
MNMIFDAPTSKRIFITFPFQITSLGPNTMLSRAYYASV